VYLVDRGDLVGEKDYCFLLGWVGDALPLEKRNPHTHRNLDKRMI
jgi:hypothetical protein